MNKNFKKMLFLGIVAIIAIPTKVYGLTSQSLYTTVKEKDEMTSALIDAYGVDYEEYLKRNTYEVSIGEKLNNKMKSYYNSTYPSYYGGMYISDDSYNLVLQIVEKNIPDTASEEYKIYNELINLDPTIKIEYVNNNYEELEKTNDYITDNILPKVEEVIGNYIDIHNNQVVLEVKKSISETKNNNIRQNLINTDLIKIVQTEEREFTSALKPGQSIGTSGMSNNCSFGFGATVNNIMGYFTAGHCFVNSGNLNATGGYAYKLKVAGSVDAAFVEMHGSYTLSNDLAFASGSITKLNTIEICPLFLVGTAVAKAGGATGYTAGTIQSNSTSLKIDSVTLSDMVQTDIYSLAGDSGGPVFLPVEKEGGATLIGIVSNNKTSSNYTMTFTKNINILNEFNYTRYE